MVHTFRCLSRIFLLDVESGSIFEIDELAETIIKEMISPLAFAKGDFSSYSTKEIDEATIEISKLIGGGVLFTKPGDYPAPEYKGIVKALCLNIAHMCNLRCAYCFAGDGQYGKVGLMSFEIAKNAVDFLFARCGDRKKLEIDFFGGEPLMNFDVVKQTVAYATRAAKDTGKTVRFTITTNAYALDDDIIDYLNENMYNVVLSIDGRKDVHDLLRQNANGEGSFDKVLMNIKKFVRKRGQKSYYVRGTYTAKNLDFAADALALNDFGFAEVSLEPVVLCESNELSIKDEHLPVLTEQYEILAKEYLTRTSEGRPFRFFHFNIDIYNGPCATKRLIGCNAGDEYLSVSTDGGIYPCHRFDGNKKYLIGNVNSKTFSDELPILFATTNLTKKEECRGCWARYYCSGGCSANSIFMCGDIRKPHKVSCELMRKRVECALAIKCIESRDLSNNCDNGTFGDK